MSKAKTESFASVWDAIADTLEEAANLRIRSELMSKIAAIVEGNGWTQTEAANHCGVTQPRVNDLLRGRISRFSLDALVNIASSLGQRVYVELDAVRVGRVSKRTASSSSRPLRQPAPPRARSRTKPTTLKRQRLSRSSG
jgi:predicted XRE-type DNA-binding protein